MRSNRHSSLRLLPFFVLLVLVPCAGRAQSSAAEHRIASTRELAEQYGKLPLSFEANRGQADPQVRFTARGDGYALFLTDAGAVLSLSRREAANANSGDAQDVVRLQLAGASHDLRVTGMDALPGTSSYFLGNDPARWRSGIATYGRVRYTGAYPGIDLVYYGNQRQLEYDFVVAPGADPKRIRVQFAGAKRLRLRGDGDLAVSAAHGDVVFRKPALYQLREGQRLPVEGRFTRLAGHEIGFAVGRYDRSRPLVIDPVLAYSTYLGGGLGDQANAIAVDSSGNAYVTGQTYSKDFPVTPGAFQPEYQSYYASNAFVTKFNPAGTRLLYSTYLGGTGGDMATSIAVDGSGNAYVTGSTLSTDFPVTKGAYQTANRSTAGQGNAFVAKLNATGSALVYSTYLGGTNFDLGQGIAIDGTGNAYVTGQAWSGDFPVTKGAFQTVDYEFERQVFTGFISKLNPAGTALVYSTFLGGGRGQSPSGEAANAIAVNRSGEAYVTGVTFSADFPVTKGAFQTVNNGAGNDSGNAFVTKLNAAGSELQYSTFLGGSGGFGQAGDQGNAIAIDAACNAYLAGRTTSPDFPVTPNAFQTTNNGSGNDGYNAFVAKLDPAGSSLVYSTFLGGSYDDEAMAVAIDGAGNAYVTGSTVSPNFPVTPNAYQFSDGNSIYFLTHAFLSVVNPQGTALQYSTYLGGRTYGNPGNDPNGDGGNGIAIDPAGNVYLAGFTYASDFPTTPGTFQTTNYAFLDGVDNAFLTKLAVETVTGTTLTVNANPQADGAAAVFEAVVVPALGSAVPTGGVIYSVDGAKAGVIALNSAGVAKFTTYGIPPGTHTVTAAYQGNNTYSGSSASLSETILPPVAAAPVFSVPSGTYDTTRFVALSDSVPGAIILCTTDPALPQAKWPKYITPIRVAANGSIMALAIAPGYSDSAVTTATYTITPPAVKPYFITYPGVYRHPASVAIGDVTAGATVYYTTDGATPTVKSAKYTGPILVTATETIQAIAIAPGRSSSTVSSATYTIE